MQTVREKIAADYENERLKRLDDQLLRQSSLRTNKSRDENLAAELQSGCTVFNKCSLKECKVDAFDYLSGKSSFNKTLIRLDKNHP